MDSNNITSLPLSQQDEDDLRKLNTEGGEPTFHTILEIWREVLRPAAEEATKKVGAQWASRIVVQFPFVVLQDMNYFRDRYFGKIYDLLELLEQEIATDPDCLSYTTMEEDAVENAPHYREVLFLWQAKFIEWENDWDCAHAMSGVELAAISEVHKMFFGPTGLTQFLDNINFEFTEADQAELQSRLEAIKAGE